MGTAATAPLTAGRRCTRVIPTPAGGSETRIVSDRGAAARQAPSALWSFLWTPARRWAMVEGASDGHMEVRPAGGSRRRPAATGRGAGDETIHSGGPDRAA